MTTKLFLPGAGGSAGFWRPVIERLPADWDCHSFSWPGLGAEPRQEGVATLDDLVALVLGRMSAPVDVVAQSMGGLVAIKVALQAPDKVRRLVLAATSGGLPLEGLGAFDWRPEYREEFPLAMPWITEVREDLSASLSDISSPTLLIWGDEDEISPAPVGEKLAQTLPNAVLRIVEGGRHDFAITHADKVAGLLEKNLS